MCAGAWLLSSNAPAAAAPWLFVSDIHLQSLRTNVPPARFGEDTNGALLESAIAAMQRADPHPPVVVVTGDLLGHALRRSAMTATGVLVARRLNRAFPQAQFVLALGNEDADCADYGLAPDSAFLRALAAAWGPMVNRRGTAPGFARTFVHDGFYTAGLPVAGLRAIVVDDVFWSPRYRAQCGPAGNVVTASMRELEGALRQARGRVWVLFHIPPGIDAFSTAHIAHRLAVVPFLTPVMRDRFVSALEKTPARVALAVAGHTHKFAYRIVGVRSAHPVPMLLVPAVSPIFRNAPSFLTANVSADGTLHDIHDMTYLHGAWNDIGGMRTLGVDAFTGPQLVALQGRLAREPALRETFARLYNGGARPEIDEHNWPIYWCSATAFASTDFRTCANTGGVGPLTERGIQALAGAGIVLLLLLGALLWWLERRRAVRA